MTPFDGLDNKAINYIDRFNKAVPLVGEFAVLLEPEKVVLYFYPSDADEGDSITASGDKLSRCVEQIKPMILPILEEIAFSPENKEEFIGQRACAKMILEEK